MKIITQTDRLLLREFLPEDGLHLFEMNNDPEVIRFTGDAPFESLAAANTFVTNYNYTAYNMGRWAVIRKEDHSFLGWCGLKYHPKERIVEVGYRFYQKFWNKGYATEACKAAIPYGFEALKLKEIYAHAHVENKASHQVATKSGLQFVKEFDYEGIPAKLFRIQSPYYSVQQISASQAHDIRHPVLRVGKPRDACKFKEDEETTTIHIGLFFKDTLIGTVTFLKNEDPSFKEKQQYQLRGMAVLSEFQNKGLGELMVTEGEVLLKRQSVARIWLNARKKAVNFYKRIGYTIYSEEFEVPIFGPHYQMTKEL